MASQFVTYLAELVSEGGFVPSDEGEDERAWLAFKMRRALRRKRLYPTLRFHVWVEAY